MTSRNSGPSQANTPETPTFCSFTVGQHVVCIDAEFPPMEHKIKRPVRGVVYTVREVRLGMFSVCKPEIGLHLVELVNPKHRYFTKDGIAYTEKLFAARRFRPLKKLSVEDFMHGDAPIDLRILDEVRA